MAIFLKIGSDCVAKALIVIIIIIIIIFFFFFFLLLVLLFILFANLCAKSAMG